MWELIFLLLPVAFFSGWCIGKRAQYVNKKLDKKINTEYLPSLNERIDKAVDAFIRNLDLSSDTVETTLALGNFFRRRGEVSRAIQIHESLILNPLLTQKQRNYSLLELAEDYIRAGMYDRAESLLLEIRETSECELETILKPLIHIYEREKDWKKALDIAKKLQTLGDQSVKRDIAHYYCELSEQAWSKGRIKLAFKYLKRSLRFDKDCVRASFLQGNFEKKLGRFEQALYAYQQIEKQDPAFSKEGSAMMVECYECMGEAESVRSKASFSLEEKATYQCRSCGFASRLLHWQCPGCRHWSEVKPT